MEDEDRPVRIEDFATDVTEYNPDEGLYGEPETRVVVDRFESDGSYVELYDDGIIITNVEGFNFSTEEPPEFSAIVDFIHQPTFFEPPVFEFRDPFADFNSMFDHIFGDANDVIIIETSYTVLPTYDLLL